MMSAGEVSGDLHGERLAKAIHRQSPETQLIGFGGVRMEAAGVKLFRNFADYNVMGVWEVIKNLRRILKLLDDLSDYMAAERPDLLVLIDYPDFNWRLAKRAKKLGIPVFSYIPPSAWAWRKGRAKNARPSLMSSSRFSRMSCPSMKRPARISPLSAIRWSIRSRRSCRKKRPERFSALRRRTMPCC